MAWLSDSWEKRTKLTIDSTYINTDLTDPSLGIPLSILNTTNYFTEVLSAGEDVRLTKSDGITELPFEFVRHDTGAETGLAYFKFSGILSSTVDTDLYINWGNPTASLPARDSTYGSENAWSSAYKGVYHFEDSSFGDTDSINDSTSNLNHGTVDGTGCTTDTTSPFGGGMFLSGTAIIDLWDCGTEGIENDWTISGYVNSETGSKGHWIGHGYSGGKVCFVLSVGALRGWKGINVYSAGWGGCQSNDWDIYEGGWKRMVMTTRSDKTATGWKDGTVTHTCTNVKTMYSTTNMNIGSYTNDNEYFKGDIDSMLFSTALDDDVVEAQYDALHTAAFWTVATEETNPSYVSPGGGGTIQSSWFM